jgi:hypothetical protein
MWMVPDLFSLREEIHTFRDKYVIHHVEEILKTVPKLALTQPQT